MGASEEKMTLEEWQEYCNKRIRILVHDTNDTIRWMKTGVFIAITMGSAGLLMGVFMVVKL